MNKLAFGLMTALVMAGCANEPYNQAWRQKPSTETVEQSDWEMLSASYLGIELFASKKRHRIAKAVAESNNYQEWNSAQYSLAAQAATDAAVGQFGSALGMNIGTGVFFAGTLLDMIDDGSVTYLSKYFIPASANIESQEQAEQYLYDSHFQRIDMIVEKLGAVGYECLFECSPGNMIVKLVGVDPTKLPPEYIYLPSNIYLQVGFGELVPVTPDSPLHAIIGEPIAWRTKGVNGYFAWFYEPVEFDEEGLATTLIAEDGKRYLAKAIPMVRTRLGRDLMAAYFNHPNMVIGTSYTHPNYLFYKGKTYSFSQTNDFADDLVTDPNLLIGK